MYSHLTEKFIEKFKTSNPHYEDKLFPHNIVLHHLAAVHRHKSHKIMSTTPERPSNQEILDLNVILLKLTQIYKLYSSRHISLLILVINWDISACLAMGLSFLFLLGPTVLDLVLVFTACLSWGLPSVDIVILLNFEIAISSGDLFRFGVEIMESLLKISFNLFFFFSFTTFSKWTMSTIPSSQWDSWNNHHRAFSLSRISTQAFSFSLLNNHHKAFSLSRVSKNRVPE